MKNTKHEPNNVGSKTKPNLIKKKKEEEEEEGTYM
jgi:hypothetical protein